MEELDLRHRAHKVGVNVHHFEWCTKYRYKMFRQEKYHASTQNRKNKQQNNQLKNQQLKNQ